MDLNTITDYSIKTPDNNIVAGVSFTTYKGSKFDNYMYFPDIETCKEVCTALKEHAYDINYIIF